MLFGVLFAMLLGAVGGFFPARSAAKKEILVPYGRFKIVWNRDLKSLRIDRSQSAPRSGNWAARWIITGVCRSSWFWVRRASLIAS